MTTFTRRYAMSNNKVVTPLSIEILDKPDERQGGIVLHPAVSKTGVGARLDEALEQTKPVNRSSNLVPLIREYAVMKKELRALLSLTKTYKNSTLAMDQARTEVSCTKHVVSIAMVGDNAVADVAMPFFVYFHTVGHENGQPVVNNPNLRSRG